MKSNRTLIATIQQLRVQSAVDKAEINRLQQENMKLREEIAELAVVDDEERIERVVRMRLQVSLVSLIFLCRI